MGRPTSSPFYTVTYKIRNKKLCNLFSSPNITRLIKPKMMKLDGHVAHMREETNACRVLVGEPERNLLLRRPRRRWRIILKRVLQN